MEKDLTEKTLESYNDVFSDILNVLLFNGQQIVKENDLSDASTISQFKTDEKIHQQERDVAKFWNNGTIRICLYGFENQTKIDYDMPLRIINYDGAGYKSQLTKHNPQRKHYPVVTLVLYFGKEHWNKRNLVECLEIPQDLKDYVSNYKINVFEIAWLKEEQLKSFKSDFKIVADYFVQQRLNKEYKPSKDTIKHVDEVLKLMSVLTGNRNYERIQQEFQEKSRQEETNMCEVLDKWYKDGFSKGVEQGISQEKLRGALETAKKLLSMYLLTNEQIAYSTGLSVSQIETLSKETHPQG